MSISGGTQSEGICGTLMFVFCFLFVISYLLYAVMNLNAGVFIFFGEATFIFLIMTILANAGLFYDYDIKFL